MTAWRRNHTKMISVGLGKNTNMTGKYLD